jgi:HD superfamily phosphodiesterase
MLSQLQNQMTELMDAKNDAVSGEQRANAALEASRVQCDDLAQKLRDALLERDRAFAGSENLKGQLAALRDRLAESERNRQYEADEKDRKTKEAELSRGQLGAFAISSCVRM